ncbi:MAG: hypothetical protein V3G42_14960 [Oscillospiraceae bacterium]
MVKFYAALIWGGIFYGWAFRPVIKEIKVKAPKILDRMPNFCYN